MLDPGAAADEESADDAFDQVHAVANCIDGQKGQGSKPAQQEGTGQIQQPYGAAVEEGCQHCFATGPQGKVDGEAVGLQRH